MNNESESDSESQAKRERKLENERIGTLEIISSENNQIKQDKNYYNF